MGGDSPLTVQIEAALQAISEFNTDVVLVGAEDKINEVLKHNEGIIEKVMLEEEKKLKKASEGAADISARSTVPVQNSGGSNKEGE